MGFPVYSTFDYIQRLTVLLADAYPTDTKARIHLFKNDVSPDANMTLDTFQQADFAGYTPVSLSMSTPSLNDQGMVNSKSNLCNFGMVSGDPQTIYGVYITDVDDAILIAAQRFDIPQQMGGLYPTAVSGVWRTSEPLSSLGWIDVEG